MDKVSFPISTICLLFRLSDLIYKCNTQLMNMQIDVFVLFVCTIILNELIVIDQHNQMVNDYITLKNGFILTDLVINFGSHKPLLFCNHRIL